MKVSRFRLWLRRMADWIFGAIYKRTRPATRQRLEQEHVVAIQLGIADEYERRIDLCREELEVLWGRYGRRNSRT